MTLFAQKINIPIHLIYYPPYHSKYNSIEHVFGVLENYWNGAILNTTESALHWASNMTWNKKHPSTVKLIENEYEKGISLSKKEMNFFEKNIIRSKHLPKWDVWIRP